MASVGNLGCWSELLVLALRLLYGLENKTPRTLDPEKAHELFIGPSLSIIGSSPHVYSIQLSQVSYRFKLNHTWIRPRLEQSVLALKVDGRAEMKGADLSNRLLSLCWCPIRTPRLQKTPHQQDLSSPLLLQLLRIGPGGAT